MVIETGAEPAEKNSLTPSPTADERAFTVELEQEGDCESRVRFDWPDVPDLNLDEQALSGRGTSPNAARLIAAAAGNCLSASLLVKYSERCLQQFEDFCVATESVRKGVPVGVRVSDKNERTVFEG